MKVREICKISHLKYMEKKGDTENLEGSLRITPKNLKKFLVIYYKKMYLHAYFHIFLSSRVLIKKNRFFPMLFKWKIETLWGWGGVKSIELDPFTIWNIFYYFFRNFLHGDTDEKVDLGKKERSNGYTNII